MTQLFRELDYSEEHSSVLISFGLHTKLLQAVKSCPKEQELQCSALGALMRLGMDSTQYLILFLACCLLAL